MPTPADRRPDDKLLMGLNVLSHGIYPTAWHADSTAGLPTAQPDYWRRVAQAAEAARFDALFLADHYYLTDPGPGTILTPIDPVSLWADIAQHTSRIGLVVTASTTYNDPWELATRILTLSAVAEGRVAWNAVTSFGDDAPLNYGLEDILERSQRYARADEFVRTVTQVWTALETQQGRRVDGDFFRFTVPAGVGLPTRSLPPVLQAGGSPQGKRLAGRYANGVFSAETTIPTARQHYLEVKQHAVDAGRNPADVKILPGLTLTLGDTVAAARAKVDRHAELGGRGGEETTFAKLFGLDIDDFDRDAPLPPGTLEGVPPELFRGSIGFRDALAQLVKANAHLSIRELLKELRYLGTGHASFVGTPEQLAARFEEWFRAGAADGFILMPGVVLDDLPILADEVFPLLRKRGLIREDYAETETFASLIGLDADENRLVGLASPR